MIYVVGTCHKTQIVSDQVRKHALGTVPLSKVEAFQSYLADTAKAVGAIAICEELTAENVAACGGNAISVAQLTAGASAFATRFANPWLLIEKNSVSAVAKPWSTMHARLPRDLTEIS